MIGKTKSFVVGDKIVHKYRGKGEVCPSNLFNTDLTTVMMKLDEDGETYEVSRTLVYLLKEGIRLVLCEIIGDFSDYDDNHDEFVD